MWVNVKFGGWSGAPPPPEILRWDPLIPHTLEHAQTINNFFKVAPVFRRGTLSLEKRTCQACHVFQIYYATPNHFVIPNTRFQSATPNHLYVKNQVKLSAPRRSKIPHKQWLCSGTLGAACQYLMPIWSTFFTLMFGQKQTCIGT